MDTLTSVFHFLLFLLIQPLPSSIYWSQTICLRVYSLIRMCWCVSIMIVSLPPVRSLMLLSLDPSTPALLNSFATFLDHIQSPSHLRVLTLPDPSAQTAASFSPSLPVFKCQLIKKLFPDSPVVMPDRPSLPLYSALFFTL